MSYWLKSLIGGALFLGSVVLFNVKLLELLDVGTCASGGPYVSARPCPDGTGTSILLLMASVFGGLIGATIFAFRGDPPGGRRRRGAASAGLLAWTVFFTGSGAVSLYAGLTDDSLADGAELGAIIVGATFLLMGLPVLAFMLWTWISDRRDPDPDDRFAPSSPQDRLLAAVEPLARNAPTPRVGVVPPPAPAEDSSTGGDAIAQLERLQRLRESGALTDAEFEAQKRRVLGG